MRGIPIILSETELLDCDRSRWPEGEWDGEPDRVNLGLRAGLPCMIRRSDLGSWCGYVGVPATHPAWGHHYDLVDVSAHGGLTYADFIDDRDLPENHWWLGFDCGHAGDIIPGMPLMTNIPHPRGDTYKNRAYVTHEVEMLAEQLSAMVRQ